MSEKNTLPKHIADAMERALYKTAPLVESDEAEQLRAKVAELQEWNTAMVKKAASGGALDGYRELGQRCADAEKRAEAAEAQLTALPKWAQSSESKGQFYRKSAQEMAALREQLAALREENLYLKEIYIDLGLHDSACRIDADGECDCWHERFADELQSLLTQTTPTVNSEGSVISGGDSDTARVAGEL